MPITVTIKNVPDAVAEGLRLRAQENRRSLQQELLLIAEQAAAEVPNRIAEPARPVYAAHKGRSKRPAKGSAALATTVRLSLDQLWQRARKLGAAMPTESSAIVRNDRDARHGR